MLRIGFVILMICWVRMLGVIKPSRSVVLLLGVSLENFTNSHQQAYSSNVFSACVRSGMLQGEETWAPNVLDFQLLQRNNRDMARWIRVTVVDNILIDDQKAWCSEYLLRYRHVIRSDTKISQLTTLEVPGAHGCGRP